MRNFILGTDWWDDCDDAVAVRILARAHKSGEICLKGIGINGCMDHSVRSLDAFMHTEGVEDVPVGIDFEGTDFGGKTPYQERLAGKYSKYSSNEDAVSAVKLYRSILADSTEPVEIVEIGFLQVISGVIESGADEISDKTGLELIKEKVSKIWVMAGRWDVEPGRENNFARNSRSIAAAKVFCEKCPVPVTFLGFEVGCTVVTGDNLEKTDVLYEVLKDHGSENGRRSWDPMLVMLALIGDEEAAGYGVVKGKAFVDAVSGENRFEKSDDAMQQYVVKKMPDDYYKNQINKGIESC